ncbi:oxidoreductase [Streptomyces sulfonofaciens]|uniref:Oxidoreductase n=1 Tax=Streptomyces sulfonofaciens TaxID=68272 RepID=A0A919G6X9_9ACTN|nr:Gfo/Idh/MocA family oxidoreductase [Streptomyces sulfonofaciens]GHH78966.1 oxidoreductase [Streptomyces sulfonofaciens]
MAPHTTGAPLRIGVLGCADIAWRHTLPAMGRVPEVRLTAVASRDPAKAERFTARFGGAAVQGYEALVDRPDVDAVYVALPTGLHHTWARRALTAGKHVLVEKPLATGLAEAEDLVATAAGHGRWIMDGFMFLHHSQHAAVRRLLDDGAIGEPRLFSSAFGIPPRDPGDVRYRPELGGGALLDVGVYTVRAAQLFLGEELTVAGSVLRRDTGRGIDLGGNALLLSAAGVPAELSFSFQSAYRSTYAIWGSEGRISLQRAYTPPADLRPTLRITRQSGTEERSLPADDQFANLVRAFAHAVRDAAGFAAHGTTLLRHMALVEEIRNRARWAAA